MKKRTRAILSVAALIFVEALWAAGGASSLVGTYSLDSNGRASPAGNRITISGGDSELHIRQISLMQGNPQEIINHDVKCPSAGGPCQTLAHPMLGRSNISNFACTSEREGDKFIVQIVYDMQGNGTKSQRYIYSPAPGKDLQVEYVYTEINPATTRTVIDNRGRGQIMKRE